jgi:ABC-type phosphate transport system auxiliary subunit
VVARNTNETMVEHVVGSGGAWVWQESGVSRSVGLLASVHVLVYLNNGTEADPTSAKMTLC